jgi:exopolysaccharide production protein ExoZ
MKQILVVQYLRGLAACDVAFHHIVLVFGPRSGWDIGSFGVDIFFIVSGFVMLLLSRGDEASFGSFLTHRLIRIAPMYWIVTLFLAACVLVKPNLFPLSLPSLWHVVASLLFIPHLYPNTDNIWPLLMQGWTLNFEMYFYFVVALSLFAPRRFQLVVVTAVFVAYFIVGAAIEWKYRVPQNYIFASFPLVIEFLGGMLLASLWFRDVVPGAKAGWLMLALGIILLIAGETLALPIGRWSRVVPCLAIVAGALALERNAKVASVGLLKLLGDSSYSLYLTHGFPMVAMAVVMSRLGIAPGLLAFVATFVAQVLLGILCYRALERPLLVGSRDFLADWRRRRSTRLKAVHP